MKRIWKTPTKKSLFFVPYSVIFDVFDQFNQDFLFMLLILHHLPDGAFPDDNDLISFLFQFLIGSLVSFQISSEFTLPEFIIRLRRGGKSAAFMSMPEASVYEQDCPVFTQVHIRLSWKVLIVNSIPKSRMIKKPSNVFFRLCILSSNFRHISASCFRTDLVHSFSHFTSSRSIDPIGYPFLEHSLFLKYTT